MNWIKTKKELNRNKDFIFSIVITLIISLTFYKLLFAFFYEDDFGAFSWAMKAELNKNLLIARWTGYWRLGMNIFFIFYNKLFGLNATPAYFFSILVQTGNALLVYFFVKILTKNRNIGLISSLLFAVGYAHGQTVSWLAIMTEDGFLGVFWLISLLLFISYLRKGYIKVYLYSLVAFMFSLMMKESAILLIPMLFLYDIMFSPKIRKVKISTLFPRYLPFLIAVTIYKLLFMVSLPMGSQSAPAMQALHSGGLSAFVYTSATILFSNMALLIVPSPIINKILPKSAWPFISIIFVLLTITMALFTKKNKACSKAIWYALFWTIINLVPYSLLWPVINYEGGRYLFISSIGTSIIITILIYEGYVKLKEMLKPNILGLIISRFAMIVVIGSILLYNIVLFYEYENLYIKQGNKKKKIIENLYSYYKEFPNNSILYLEGDDLPFKELVIPGGILSVIYHNKGGDTLKKERDFVTLLSLLERKKYIIDRLYAFNYDRDTEKLENRTRKLRSILENAQALDYNFVQKREKSVSFPWKASNPYKIRNGNLSTESLEKTVWLETISKPLSLGTIPIIHYTPDKQLPAIIPYQIEIKMRISPRRLNKLKFPYLRLSSRQSYFSAASTLSVFNLNPNEFNIIKEKLQLRYEQYPKEDRFKYISEYKNAQKEFRLYSIASSSSDYNSQQSAKKILDGKYGPEDVWVPFYFVNESWVKIDIQSDKVINRVIWSRDRTGKKKDRIPISYTIQTSLDDKNWTVVKKVQDYDFTTEGNYKVDDFEPIKARYIKMVISKTKNGFWAPAIDEFEVVETKFNYIKDFNKLEKKFNDPFAFVSSREEAREIYEAIGTKGRAEISWLISKNNDWDKKNSKEFVVALDNQFHVYRVEIDADGLIADKIKGLKLNPLNIPGTVEIDYIKIKPKILISQGN